MLKAITNLYVSNYTRAVCVSGLWLTPCPVILLGPREKTYHGCDRMVEDGITDNSMKHEVNYKGSIRLPLPTCRCCVS